MTTPLRPAPASLYGSENWIYVTTIASTALIPTAAEVNAGSSLDITNIAFADTGKPSQSTNRVAQERRLGDTTVPEALGATTITGGTLHYAFDPQAAVGSNGKKLFEKIPAGQVGYLVERLGILNTTTPATGQFVNVYPVQFGNSFPTRAGDNETAQAGMACDFAVTAPPAVSVALT